MGRLNALFSAVILNSLLMHRYVHFIDPHRRPCVLESHHYRDQRVMSAFQAVFN